MNLKFCISKMVGAAPVYQTSNLNIWVSSITDSTVKWYLSEGAAREALGGPETFVVPYEDITMAMRCDALLRACEALSEAVRVGAIDEVPDYASLYVNKDVFDGLGINPTSTISGEASVTRHGYVNGIPVSCQTLQGVDE